MAGLDPLPPMILARWTDAHSYSIWTDPGDVDDEALVVTSIGFRLDLKAGHLCLAQTLDPEGTLDSMICIPLGMVIETASINLGGTSVVS